MSFVLAVIVAVLFLGPAHAQADLGACAKGCVDNIYADPSRLKCNPTDMSCICRAEPDLGYGIRDCVTQACTLTGDALTAQVDAALGYNNQQCAPILGTTTSILAPATPATAVTTPPPPTTAPTTTIAGFTAQGATVTPAASSSPSPSPSSNPSSKASTNTAAATAQSSGSSSTATGEPTTSSASSSEATTTAGSNADTAQTSSSVNRLSTAAKAGIGAGAGVAAVAVGIMALLLVLRRKKKAQSPKLERRQSPPRPPRSPAIMEISRPLPGSGRITADDVERGDPGFPVPAAYSHSTNSNSSSHPSPKSTYTPSRPSREDDELDLRGRRYEDMIPRAQPKTMF